MTRRQAGAFIGVGSGAWIVLLHVVAGTKNCHLEECSGPVVGLVVPYVIFPVILGRAWGASGSLSVRMVFGGALVATSPATIALVAGFLGGGGDDALAYAQATLAFLLPVAVVVAVPLVRLGELSRPDAGHPLPRVSGVVVFLWVLGALILIAASMMTWVTDDQHLLPLHYIGWYSALGLIPLGAGFAVLIVAGLGRFHRHFYQLVVLGALAAASGSTGIIAILSPELHLPFPSSRVVLGPGAPVAVVGAGVVLAGVVLASLVGTKPPKQRREMPVSAFDDR